MAEISLTIHGKSYGIACDDGQETRVKDVGQYVDSRARDIAAAGAASNENHLLVLTALVLADEIKELRESLRDIQADNHYAASQGAPQDNLSDEDERRIVESIEQLAMRIDNVAARLRTM